MDVHIEREPSRYLGLTSGEWTLLVIAVMVAGFIVYKVVANRCG